MWLWKSERRRHINMGACSDTGRVRQENQDAHGWFPPQPSSRAREKLFVVADGMGGHTRGREAGQTAVDVVQQAFFANADQPVAERLRQAFIAANDTIYQRAHAPQTPVNGHRNGHGNGQATTMGTTCTALALINGQIHIAHVGDSRAYRINRKNVERLTQDHTMVEELLRAGVLTEEEAKSHPRRNVLVRAMGVAPTLEVDVFQAGPLASGDHYLLCTDGLAVIPLQKLQHVVLHQTPQDACENLVALANEHGGFDNVTALLIQGA